MDPQDGEVLRLRSLRTLIVYEESAIGACARGIPTPTEHLTNLYTLLNDYNIGRLMSQQSNDERRVEKR